MKSHIPSPPFFYKGIVHLFVMTSSRFYPMQKLEKVIKEKKRPTGTAAALGFGARSLRVGVQRLVAPEYVIAGMLSDLFHEPA